MNHLVSAVLGLSFAAGLNTYATVLALGLLGRFHVLELPVGLRVLSSTYVIAAAAVLYVIEFVADKVPYFDTLWDSLHTIIRPAAGALLAYGVVSSVDPQWEVIAALVDMQFANVQEPASKMNARELEERIRTIALVHENLYQSVDLSQVRVRSYFKKLTDNLIQAFSPGGVDLKLEISNIPLNIETAIPCGLIVTELVTNAFKYAFPKEWKRREGQESNQVLLKMWAEGEEILLEVSDNGIGLSQDFDWRATRSLGLRLVNRLANQLHGILTVSTLCGTKYRLVFTLPEGVVNG